MRTLFLSKLVGGVLVGGTFVGGLTLAVPVQAEDAPKAGVTLSESEGAKAATPVVQVKSEVPSGAAPAAAAGTGGKTAGGAGMSYCRYGGAATESDSEWGFRY